MFYNVKKGPLKIPGKLLSKIQKNMFEKKSRSPIEKGRIEFLITYLELGEILNKIAMFKYFST